MSDSVKIQADPPRGDRETWELVLFVTGNNTSKRQIASRLDRLFKARLPVPFRMDVVDIFKTPAATIEYDIFATPTLLRVYPKPKRRVVGDLTDIDRVLYGMGIPSIEAFKNADIIESPAKSPPIVIQDE